MGYLFSMWHHKAPVLRFISVFELPMVSLEVDPDSITALFHAAATKSNHCKGACVPNATTHQEISSNE